MGVVRRLSEGQQVVIGTPPSTHYEIAKVVWFWPLESIANHSDD